MRMPRTSPPPASRQTPQPGPGSLRIGDRRDVKQESSFYDGSSSLRRPLRQALIADRKR